MHKVLPHMTPNHLKEILLMTKFIFVIYICTLSLWFMHLC